MKEKIAKIITITMIVVGIFIIIGAEGAPDIYRSFTDSLKMILVGIIIILIGWILYPTQKGSAK